ncbi:hypothetical protein VZT92_017283 [Zoarces viviparus]|uniref:C-type lectin domain-containing protein n=1 Tax=Zoarces viviparus TaxID=48416 RepID=A0AAW1ERR8_ZOAVI
MQWSLFVLILMGQCSFCLCRLYEYRFVEEKKTWDEAQKYCRDKYTDLAKVFDMTDVKRLRDSAGNQGGAWIGLHNPHNDDRTWLWSLPGVEFNDSETEWAGGGNNPENCVVMVNHKWIDHPCNHKHPFICYDEPNQNKFHLIDEKKTWLEAQSYCREHYTDLVSVPTQLNHEELKKIESDHSRDVWIGLFRDTWRWSDGSSFSFRSWDPEKFNDESNKRCAMTVSNGKWSSDECSHTKPFFCYDDEMILIKENKTWEQALTYCRENHHDLVSITNRLQQGRVEEKAKQANSPYVWLGLRYSCPLDLWFWVSDNLVCYDNWAPENRTEDCDIAVAMSARDEHKWFRRSEKETHNFICARKFRNNK